MSIEKMYYLRQNGELEAARDLMAKLVEDTPENSFYHYQMAWCYDNLGQEKDAIIYYENAFKLGLDFEHRLNASIGYGSTCRALGYYEQANTIFTQALKEFPTNNALKIFHAMTQFNLHAHEESMNTLLQIILDTTNDPEIQSYNKAIDFYRSQLTTIWP